MKHAFPLFASLLLAFSQPLTAQEKVLNLYSARHYQTDEKLYENFTKQTGIKINRIDGKEDELMERIKEAIALCLEVEGETTETLDFVGVQRVRLAS